MLLDGRWTEPDAGMASTDPLKFVDTRPYAARLREAKKKLGMNDAIITAEGQLSGRPVVMCAMEFGFIGGATRGGGGGKNTPRGPPAPQTPPPPPPRPPSLPPPPAQGSMTPTHPASPSSPSLAPAERA